MKKIFLPVFLLFLSFAVKAQPAYNQAAGLKFPGGFSFTYKKFVTDVNNLEGQMTIWKKGLRVSGLYELNFYSFNKLQNLSWFVGPGVHVGFWKDEYKDDYKSRVDLGIDGIIGLDYKFDNAPINMSLDWQPSVTLIGSAGFTPVYGGIAVRYTF